MENITTRFAPSPTGYLHKGHAFSALTAFYRRQNKGFPLVLRIEDIDQTRCRSSFIDAIFEDLIWLGLSWDKDVRVQSNHMNDYQSVLEKLRDQGLIYPCFCTRRDIMREIENMDQAPHLTQNGTAVYPGTCRHLSRDLTAARLAEGSSFAWRLDAQKALDHFNTADLVWFDELKGEQKINPDMLSDIILARKDTPTSYNLAVTHDDYLQGMTHIVRGEDLFETTHIHVFLQKILKYPTPVYHHHRLLLDKNGKRYAKRNKSVTLRELRQNGISAAPLRSELGFSSS